MTTRKRPSRSPRKCPPLAAQQDVFTLWDLIGREPSAVPRGRTVHVVEHSVWRGRNLVHPCCHGVWTLRIPKGPPIAFNRIITGPGRSDAIGPEWIELESAKVSRPFFHPLIERHCMALAAKIGKGRCFTNGPLGSSGRRIGGDSDYRLPMKQLKVVDELHFALAATPRYRQVTLPGKSVGEPSTAAFQSLPGQPAWWEVYLTAHRSKSSLQRNRLLRQLLDGVWDLCPSLPAATTGPGVRLRQRFWIVLSSRHSTGQGGTRRRYLTPADLAYALGAKVLDVHERTLRRRVFLHSPYQASFA